MIFVSTSISSLAPTHAYDDLLQNNILVPLMSGTSRLDDLNGLLISLHLRSLSLNIDGEALFIDYDSRFEIAQIRQDALFQCWLNPRCRLVVILACRRIHRPVL